MVSVVNVIERNYSLNNFITESIYISVKLIVSIISANGVFDVEMRNSGFITFCIRIKCLREDKDVVIGNMISSIICSLKLSYRQIRMQATP